MPGICVLQLVADSDAPEGVEDGQVELAGHVHGPLHELPALEEGGELGHLLQDQLLHACWGSLSHEIFFLTFFNSTNLLICHRKKNFLPALVYIVITGMLFFKACPPLDIRYSRRGGIFMRAHHWILGR